MREAGRRVGAILKADENTVHLLGYGTYEGDEVPGTGFLHEANITNPKIKLDDGRVVWGYQCWWGDEEATKKSIGNREVIDATVDG